MAADSAGADQSYHRDKLTAKAGDEQARIELAARDDVRPEILYFLTDDDSPLVRQELASNDATPRQADLLLAEDEEETVRAELAGKVSKLIPDLDLSAQDKIQLMTIEMLEILARDQATKVRQILAETLQDVASAPPQVINRLARDAEIVVAKPILTFSPVLSDDDLLDIIASSPIAGALGAIAERDNVSESVVDAIAETDDIGAIGSLRRTWSRPFSDAVTFLPGTSPRFAGSSISALRKGCSTATRSLRTGTSPLIPPRVPGSLTLMTFSPVMARTAAMRRNVSWHWRRVAS